MTGIEFHKDTGPYLLPRQRETKQTMTEESTYPELVIYTDGACSPNPGPGGWGAVILSGDSPVSELSGYGGESTNNRMELTGAVAAFKSLQSPHRIVLYTDSQYVKNGITDWIHNWQQNNWHTAARKPVKNADLWKELLIQIKRHKITWKWVRGHGTNRWNIRADELAVAARKSVDKPAEKQKTAVGAGDDIHLFTGVTCKHSTGIGGWAVILTWRDRVRILGGRAEGMTANQLYIKAVIGGIESLKKPLPVHVHTHSGYLRDGANSWLEGWRKRNWQTRDGAPVSNKELWQELSTLLEQHKVSFHLEGREDPLCSMQEAKELAREFEQGL